MSPDQYRMILWFFLFTAIYLNFVLSIPTLNLKRKITQMFQHSFVNSNSNWYKLKTHFCLRTLLIIEFEFEYGSNYVQSKTFVMFQKSNSDITYAQTNRKSTAVICVQTSTNCNSKFQTDWTSPVWTHWMCLFLRRKKNKTIFTLTCLISTNGYNL